MMHVRHPFQQLQEVKFDQTVCNIQVRVLQEAA